MSENNEKIEVARISAFQAIAVALIAASAGAASTYMSVQGSSNEVKALEAKTISLGEKLKESEEERREISQKLNILKQRVRDILGPKEDELRSMSLSLERMKNAPGVDQSHRDRLEEIANRLDKIDSKVLEIVQ